VTYRLLFALEEVVPALAGDGEHGGIADGRLAAAAAERRAGMAVGSDRREAGSDVASGDGRAAARGIPASYGAVWRFFAHEGITFKKSLHASEQDRPDAARRRARWKRHQGRLDPKRLVFIDETWAKTNMTRRHGRALRGTRLIAKVPHRRWRTLTFLAALRCDRIEAPCVIDGPINGRSFLAYVEQVLVPTLTGGEIVIMDNLGSHKRQAIRRLIRAAGAKLFFLPPSVGTRCDR
jgi:hypothetical protein